MTKVLLDTFIRTVAVEFENTPKELVESLGITKELPKNVDKAFGSLYTDDTKTGLKTICEVFDAKYGGCSFNFWLGKQGRYVAAGPHVYNNGQGAALDWGGTITQLKGDLPGTAIGSTLRIKADKDGNSYRMTIGIGLNHDGTEEGRKKAEEKWQDCDSWEEAVNKDLLKLRLRVPPRDELFAKDRDLMVLSAEIKERDGRAFWVVNCKDRDGDLGKFQIFLPDEANPVAGLRFKINAGDKCFEIRDEKFYSAQYLSLGQFNPKDVLTVERVERDKKFGGWNLHTDKGIVSANSQFNRWYEKEGTPTIGENGFGKIIITVLKVEKQSNRAIVLIDIKVAGRKVDGLAALLGKKPVSSEVPANWEEADEKDDWGDVEPEPQGLAKALGKLEETPNATETEDAPKPVASASDVDWL